MKSRRSIFVNCILSFAEKFIFLLVSALQIVIFFTVATDNNGDPNDYLSIAKSLFSSDSKAGFLRFYGYPFFIKIASLNLYDLNLIFFSQSVIFLTSLYYFANVVGKSALWRCLIYMPGLIPAVAYLPKLIFPDSLVLSLLLFFGAAIFGDKKYHAAFAAFLLTIVKLVFVFLFPLLLLQFLTKRGQNKKFCFLLYCATILLLVPAVYVVSPFSLYQTMVQKPGFINEESPDIRARSSLKITCDKNIINLTAPDLLSKINDHSSDALYMPFGEVFFKEFGCSLEDVKKLQRELILYYLNQDVWGHTIKYLKRALGNILMQFNVNHIGHMLSVKYGLLSKFYSDAPYYQQIQVDNFNLLNLTPTKPPSYKFLQLLAIYNNPIQNLIRKFLFFSISFLIILLVIRKVKFISPELISLVLLCFTYSLIISFFAFGYDRYIFINYFLLMGIFCILSQALLNSKNN